MKTTFLFLIALSIPALAYPADAPAPASPAVAITLGARHGHVTPCRQGFAQTGGGNIDVAQPSPDTVVITMTGVAVAGGHPLKDSLATLQFDLDQTLDVTFSDPKFKKAKLTVEARAIGLLSSHRGGGSAEQGQACVRIACGTVDVATLCVQPHSVSCGESLSQNCREEPLEVPVIAARYTLNQTFLITASHPRSLRPCKAASAEFAPDPALDPLWISYHEPFHGASKKDLGFQIIIKAVVDPELPEEKK